MDATARSQYIQKIIAWVDAYRVKDPPKTLYRVPLPELSCFTLGEGYNLLMRQLVNTVYPHGNWQQLLTDETGEIIQLVLDEMPKHT
jgi:hypothetical protein